MEIKVYKDGTRVFIDVMKQHGTIVGTIIRQRAILYEVGYNENGTYKVITLAPYEFTVQNAIKEIKIGYKQSE